MLYGTNELESPNTAIVRKKNETGAAYVDEKTLGGISVICK